MPRDITHAIDAAGEVLTIQWNGNGVYAYIVWTSTILSSENDWSPVPFETIEIAPGRFQCEVPMSDHVRLFARVSVASSGAETQ